MKAFWLSLLTLFLLAAAVTADSLVCLSLIGRTERQIASLPRPAPDAPDLSAERAAADELARDWQRRERFVSLTLNHEDLMQVASALATLRGAAEADDRPAYLAAVTQLSSALAHLRRLAGLSPGSIF